MDIRELGTSPADEVMKDARKLDLESNLLELHVYGLTVIPPEKVAAPGLVERLSSAIVRVMSERTGVDLSRCDDLPEDYLTREANAGNWYYLYEDEAFIEAALNPTCLTVTRFALGQGAKLSGAAVIMKGTRDSPSANLVLHSDNHGVPCPVPSTAYSLNTSWILTDYVSKEDGPTVLVPGSHNFGRIPQPFEAEHWVDDPPVKTVPLEARAGSLAVWQGNTWHGSIARTKPGVRVTLVYNWVRSFMQSICDWGAELPTGLLDRHPELERVLGLDHPYPYRRRIERPDRIAPFMAHGNDPYA